MSKGNNTEPKGKAAKTSPGVRRLLKVMKWFAFPLLCLMALYAGLRIGYVRFGGGDPEDVLQLDTWKHMLDLVFQNT
ncbi:DNA-directed RNA polymerase subunit beta [Paenibacillus alkalitolerans]|uniref:DNA-directed RNA polymerase subunit beta n=1 Tax=Paenibacillus alkalitolerans TaxID=2799335 RepID=UPI001F413898|nr:DNA-directed RNA polymerase subunit beta [Paenibacillus alkalitolerans]